MHKRLLYFALLYYSYVDDLADYVDDDVDDVFLLAGLERSTLELLKEEEVDPKCLQIMIKNNDNENDNNDDSKDDNSDDNKDDNSDSDNDVK